MDLILQPSATLCAATNTAFQAGDRVICYLGYGGDGQVTRWDVLATAAEQFTVPERLICRWVHVFKPRTQDDNPERTLKLGAESLFTTLCDPAAEVIEANTPLIQFLALMLERKKLLRPKGLTADRARRIYEHAKTKQLYEVPVGDLTPEFFVKVQEQLGVLVGEPKKKPEAAAVVAPAPVQPKSMAADAAEQATPTTQPETAG